MDITEGIGDEEVDVGGGEEEVGEEAQEQLAAVTPSTVQAERNDLGQDDNEH